MRRLVLAVVATVMFAATSQAAVTTYTNSAAFFAALGATPSFTETFQGPAVNETLGPGGTLGASLNGLTYNYSPPTFGGGQGIGRIDGDTATTFAYNGFGIGSDPATIQSLAIFRNPVAFAAFGETSNTSEFYPGESFTVMPTNGDPLFAVGVFVNANPGVTQPGDFFIQTAVGTANNGDFMTAVPGTGGVANTLFFMGLISDTPFPSATIGSNTTGQADTTTFRFFFNADNLTFSTVSPTQVPEPATMVILGGMIGVGGLVYRRRRTAAGAA